MRRRIKEQLKRMGRLEYWAVNFSYIDLETSEEKFVNVPEHGPSDLMPPITVSPGAVFTIGTDTSERKNCLFRIEVQAMKGTGRKKVTYEKNKRLSHRSQNLSCSIQPALIGQLHHFSSLLHLHPHKSFQAR